MKGNITERPGSGIFTVESKGTEPIGWLSIYNTGFTGQLHVIEEHQRRGLARALIRHAVNTVSSNLLLSEGWELQPVNYKRKIYRIVDQP